MLICCKGNKGMGPRTQWAVGPTGEEINITTQPQPKKTLSVESVLRERVMLPCERPDASRDASKSTSAGENIRKTRPTTNLCLIFLSTTHQADHHCLTHHSLYLSSLYVTTPSEIILYYRLNHSIWSLSDNKESSR
jgi:hypothetical protein